MIQPAIPFDPVSLKTLLNEKVSEYDHPGFIDDDPISIPHRFQNPQDVEIMAFFAAILAWGNRKMIIRSCERLLQLMDNSPYDFIKNHSDEDLKPFTGFVHRTFNATDLLYFMAFLKAHYNRFPTLETAFSQFIHPESTTVEAALIGFHDYFFSLPDVPQRTRKHIATPVRKSACKRLNMFLRWMVRHDEHGVDFGLWKCLKPSQLMCPLDIHVSRTARQFGLLTRKQDDWRAVAELTANLRLMCPEDPVKYDFALFGLGAIG